MNSKSTHRERSHADEPAGPTPELLAHLQTIEREGPRAGDKPQRWRDPAHRRLRRGGRIEPEDESAIQTLIEDWVLYQHGAREAGSGNADAGGSIVTRQMLAGDTVRRFARRYGVDALAIIIAACEECLRPADIARRWLGHREPGNPARPSNRWKTEGQALLDQWIVDFCRVMRKKPLDKARDNIADSDYPAIGAPN